MVSSNGQGFLSRFQDSQKILCVSLFAGIGGMEIGVCPLGPQGFFSYDIATKHESFFAFLGIIDPSSPLPLRGHQAQVTKCYMINVVVLFRLSVAARAMELQTVSTVGINQIRSHVRKKLKASCKSQVNASRFCFKDLNDDSATHPTCLFFSRDHTKGATWSSSLVQMAWRRVPTAMFHYQLFFGYSYTTSPWQSVAYKKGLELCQYV